MPESDVVVTTDRTETGAATVTVNRDDYDAVLNLAERLWRIAEHHPNCTLSGLPGNEVEAFARLLHADQAHMPKRLRENVNRHRTGYLRAAIDRIEATADA